MSFSRYIYMLADFGIIILICCNKDTFAAQSDELFTCGFETGLCSMEHGPTGHFQWTKHHGLSHQSSGPASAFSGNYYIDLNVGYRYPAWKAIIKTRPLPYSGDLCVSFACHMFGVNIGSLTVTTTNPRKKIFFKEGNQGDRWRLIQLNANINSGSRIKFEGLTGSGPLGNIALDEIHVARGRCESQDNKICDPLQHYCPGGQRCSPDGDVYRCSCAQGYDMLDGEKTCQDFNECMSSRSCHHLCNNTQGSYHCYCREGYSLLADGYTCTDIDECTTDHGCSQRCTNTDGSYYCTCDTGYSSVDGDRTCQDIDECASNNGCSQRCANTDGSYYCTCYTGYNSLDGGRTCQDTDECNNPHLCQNSCTNTAESYRCTCDPGYSSIDDGRTCQDTDECRIRSLCQHSCTNTAGSYYCTCETGYSSTDGGHTCQDIDECTTDHGCSQRCTNTDGSYTCTCDIGYRSMDDGRTCQDIDECEGGRLCDHSCNNTRGSYHCYCPEGYGLLSNGYTCTDIDECATGRHGCSQQCTNTGGGYRCTCDTGYNSTDGGRTCQECVPGKFGDGCNQECHCAGEEGCNVTTGACPMADCAGGYTGDTCSEACSSGRFGHDCRQECHCAGGEGCDVTTGICPLAACADGFTGNTCSEEAGPSTAAVAGGVIAFLVLLIVVGGVVVFILRRRRQESKAVEDYSYAYVNRARRDGDGRGTETGSDVNRQSTATVSIIDAEDGWQTRSLTPSDAVKQQVMAGSSTSEQTLATASHLRRCRDATVKASLNGRSAKSNPPAARLPVPVPCGADAVQDESKSPNNQDKSDGDENAANDDDHLYYNYVSVAKSAVPALLAHVKTLRKSKTPFEEEFNRLPVDQLFPWNEATKEGQKAKNRFKNILPYDKNRVRLSHIPGDPCSDYINASYIDGVSTEEKFIASHGPTDFTKSDFWRMVWEKDVSVIAMVTNLVEAGNTRCAKYWPDEADSMTYGDITITLTNEESAPDVIHRTFLVSKEGAEDRVVYQCHYTSWPDHGVPDDTTSIIRFHKRVRQMMEPGRPTVVHCSAGVGRTGTFIAIDILLKEAERTGSVDVFRCVNSLRQQKIQMVQTLPQYAFIYDTILEALSIGDTTIPCDTFTAYMRKSEEVVKQQFLMLDEMKPMYTAEDRKVALSKVNRDKNRNQNNIPRESKRLILTSRVEGRTNYINAVFVHRYGRKNAFVVTQMPIKGTVIDFWRMIFDWRFPTVVLLGEKMESLMPGERNGETVVSQYHLTTNRTTKGCDYAEIRQTHVRVEKSQQQSMSQNAQHVEKQSVSCCFLEVSASHPTDLPASLLSRLYSILHSTDAEHPIVFVCRDGYFLSGVAVASFSMFDMISLTNTVDVFHITKQVKDSKPEFIPTLAEYRHLHSVAKDYIEQSQTYANFH